MKKFSSLVIVIFILLSTLGCSKKSASLNPANPITLNMWHVYGEQADSPMHRYVEEFNSTVGKQKGVIINITLLSNAQKIGGQLLSAQKNVPGVPSMPDLFFCHNSNAAQLGKDNLLHWNDVFSDKELKEFVPSFLKDGIVEDSLCVLPVSKSTHLLFLAGGSFDRFSEKTGYGFKDLATWDGFFEVAKKYYEYSGNKPFCAIDYVMRSVELDAISKGATDFYNENGWYKDNDIISNSYKMFAESIAKGYIIVSDLYSNTQVMTGETIAGISSSAAVLYYNDTITYPDNTSEKMDLKVLPVPTTAAGSKYATQAGVGLCAYKTTAIKAEAATVFAKWFTEKKRNLDFVAQTGYMPVKNGAFDYLDDYPFENLSDNSYKNETFKITLAAMKTTKDTCTFLSENSAAGYYPNTYKLYDNIRKLQRTLKEKYSSGSTAEEITNELTELFRNTGK